MLGFLCVPQRPLHEIFVFCLFVTCCWILSMATLGFRSRRSANLPSRYADTFPPAPAGSSPRYASITFGFLRISSGMPSAILTP
jgi:hypothetical protein